MHKQARKQENNRPPLTSLTALIAASIIILGALITMQKRSNFAKERKEYSKQDTFQPAQVTEVPQLIEVDGKAPINSSQEITRLETRLKALFSSTYLTLISIIQGVVLSYLAFIVYNNYKIFDVSNWIQVVCSCLFVVSVWFEYMMGATVFVWIPTLYDSLIPFCLGVTELFEMGSIGPSLHYWLLSISVLGFIALWAFINMFHQAKKEFDENKLVLEALGKYKIFSELFCLFGAIFFLVLGLLSLILGDGEKVRILFTATAIIIVSAFVIRSNFYWKAIINKIKPQFNM